MTKPRNGPRTPGAVLQAWEERTHLVKQELAAESAAMDAKTNRLRALRLEKERLDAETAPEPCLKLPTPPRRPSRSRA